MWYPKKVEMKIKPLYAVLLVAAVVLLVVGVTLYFTWETPEQTSQPQSYTPTYTADQVIAIAQAQYPACFNRDRTVDTPSSISVKHIGGSRGAWRVEISCPARYFHNDYSMGTKTLYFYESDGTLRKTYYP